MSATTSRPTLLDQLLDEARFMTPQTMIESDEVITRDEFTTNGALIINTVHGSVFGAFIIEHDKTYIKVRMFDVSRDKFSNRYYGHELWPRPVIIRKKDVINIFFMA